MTNDVKMYRAIERVRSRANHFGNTEWEQADLNSLASEVGEALDDIADALEAIRESIPK
jgi:hypothetical protein